MGVRLWRVLLASLLLGLVAAGSAQAGGDLESLGDTDRQFARVLSVEPALAQMGPAARAPQNVHRAVIKITRAKVTKKGKIRVTTRITGLSQRGAHWKLMWKKKGTKQKSRDTKRVRGNRRGKTVVTGRLTPGRYIVEAVIVQRNGKPFKARQFPAATLAAKRTVRVKRGVCQIGGVGRDGVIRAFQTQDISQVIGTISVHAQRGAEIALEVINGGGGVGGCELRVVFVDEAFDGADPAGCLGKYRKAIQSGKYQFYIGPTASTCMVALPDLTKAAGKFLLSGIAAEHHPYMESYAAQGPHIMHPGVSPFLEARAMAQWAIDNGFKRAAVMTPNYAYGQNVSASFVSSFEAAGGTVVSQQFPDFDEENLTPFINAMVAAGPDLIVAAMFGEFVLPFWQQWKASGNDQNIPNISGLAFSSTFEAPGLRAADIPANTYGYNRGDWHLRCATPTGAKLCRRWAEKYGRGDAFPIPGAFAFVNYAEILAAAALIEAAGTMNPDDWVAVIESGRFAYDGPYNVGPTHVNPVNHMADTCAEVGKIVGNGALPNFPVSYEPTTLQSFCMHDILPRAEVRQLTDNPTVGDGALQTYLNRVNADFKRNRPVKKLPG